MMLIEKKEFDDFARNNRYNNIGKKPKNGRIPGVYELRMNIQSRCSSIGIPIEVI